MKNYSGFYYALTVFLFLTSAQGARSQETKPIINAALTGRVIDAISKQPIEGVTVQLDAVTHSVKTDRQGNFQFVTGQKLPFKIKISSVGMRPRSWWLLYHALSLNLLSSIQNLINVWL